MNNFHLEGAGGKSTWIARQVSTKTVSPSRCFLYLTLEFSAKPAQKSYLTLGQVSTGTNKWHYNEAGSNQEIRNRSIG